jgi:hypothetical protein
VDLGFEEEVRQGSRHGGVAQAAAMLMAEQHCC